MNTAPPNRRRFLLGTAGACAALGAGSWGILKSSLGSKRWTLVQRTSHALGAAVTVSVWHRDEAAGEAALEAAFAELELVESVMSLYRADSQISRLNREAVLEKPHPLLVRVLQYAAHMAEQTGGAFDITVQPLWDLYGNARKHGRLPDEAEVRDTRNRVAWQRVSVTDDRISLSGEGTAITLNGIAQGFAADAAMAALRRAGVAHALIDTGEMAALGAKPDGAMWKVGIQHPRHEDAFVALAALQDRCLATSGDYETRFSDDFVHHHIFDPRTGHSPTELASASIAAPSAMTADALSTAVFVLGATRGMELVRQMTGTDAMLVLKNGDVIASGRFPAQS